MASASILITGATGRLGRLVVRALLDRGEPVRAFTRRPQIATSLFGKSIEIAAGDFADADSLGRAFTSVDRVLLLSPLSPHLFRDQIAVIGAAERAGAARIVKISGSDWTIDPPGNSISGVEHAKVEARLRQSAIPSVTIRPNGWMQVSLPGHIAQIKADKPLVSAYGDARVSFIDARDIADVAVSQLLARQPAPGPLVITGPEALSVGDIATIASRQLGRPVAIAAAGPFASDAPRHDFEQRAVAEFLRLIAEGRASGTTDTVAGLLDRAPRTVAAFIAEQLEAVAA